MLFKASFVCSVVCVLVVGSLAQPPRNGHPRDVNSMGEFPADLEESIKKLATEVDKSIKQFAKNMDWMLQSINKIFRKAVEDGFQNVATWAMDLVMRSELFMMADGSHFNFPVSGKADLEQEYKAVAIAVSNLVRNLKTMQRADMVMTNASKSLVTGDSELFLKERKSSSEKMLKTLLHTYVFALDHQFESDEVLASEYRKQKIEAKEFVKQDPKMREPLNRLWEQGYQAADMKKMETFLQDKAVFRQAVPNKEFLKQTVKHFAMIFSPTHHKRFLLARALLQKAASDSYNSKVNEVYKQALLKAEKVSVYDDPESVFFEALEKALEQERSLNAEIQTLMKQVEESTVYDAAVLHIDFSLL